MNSNQINMGKKTINEQWIYYLIVKKIFIFRRKNNGSILRTKHNKKKKWEKLFKGLKTSRKLEPVAVATVSLHGMRTITFARSKRAWSFDYELHQLVCNFLSRCGFILTSVVFLLFLTKLFLENKNKGDKMSPFSVKMTLADSDLTDQMMTFFLL